MSFIEVIWGEVWQFFAVKCSSEHKEEIFLFSIKNIYLHFYWSIVELQYYISFIIHIMK